MPYVAMEHPERGSLRPLLGRLSLAQASLVLEGVLGALDHVHGRLTPDDVIVAGGRVEVTGFGVAPAPGTLTSLSVTTAAYMAPEHPLGLEISPRSDLYSVGCLAYALLTGAAPFGDSGSPVAVLLRHVNDPVPRLQDVDPRVADWVERLLAKAPSERPSDAAQAWVALEAILFALLGPSWRDKAALSSPRPTGILDAAPPTHDLDAQVTPAHTLVGGLAGQVSRDRQTRPDTPGSPHLVTPVGAATTPPAAATPSAPTPRPARRRPARARTRPTWAMPAAISGGVAAVAIAAGALAADGPAERDAPARPIVLHTAGVAVEVPSGVRVIAAGAPGVPGLTDALTARGPGGATIVVGRADRTAFNRQLLPDGLRARARSRTIVLRSGGQAVRHDRLTVAGRTASIYSVATPDGVTLLACFATTDACAATASTLRGATLPLGPDRRFAAGAARVLERLEARERALTAKLDRAETREQQVWAIKRLWWAYLGEAKALRQLDVRPADRELRAELAEALRLAGCAYGRAANRGDSARQRAIVLTQQANAQAAIERLGYDLPAGAASFPRLPDLL